MKKKIMSIIAAVGCAMSTVTAQAAGSYSMAWNETTGSVSVSADTAGTYDVIFANNGKTQIEELTFNEAGTQTLSAPEGFAASKVLMWDSAEKMKPLTEAMDLTECYGTAVVDSVAGDKVYFKMCIPGLENRWIVDEEADIKIIKNGEEIDYTEIEENDILTILYDVEAGLEYSEFFNIFVSNDVVMGDVTSVNTDANTMTINGREYECNRNLVEAESDMLACSYKIYLDSFGKVAYCEEIEKPKNYGIVVGMYKQIDNEYATVRLITTDGSITEYECESSMAEVEFYELVSGNYGEYQGETVTKTDIINGVGIENAVCEYAVSDGKISVKDYFAGKGGMELEYKEVSDKLGSYAMQNDITVCLDLKDYIENDGAPVSFKTTDFVDEELYIAYLYDKNSSGCYRLVIITDGELAEEQQPVNKSGIGVIMGMQKNVNDDFASVTIITSDGIAEQYECADSTEQAEFYSLISGDEYTGQTVTRDKIIAADIGNFFCEFTVENDKISFDKKLDVVSGEFEYSESSMKIGDVEIGPATIILDADPYIYDSAENWYPIMPNALIDGEAYYIYSYVDIIVLATPKSLLTAKSELAVVKEFIGTDGSSYGYIVTRYGTDDTEVWIEQTENTLFTEGDVIVYETAGDVVDCDNVVCVMNAETDYDSLLENTLSHDNFSEMINSGCIDADTNNILYGAENNNNVKLYFGIIYTKSNNVVTLITDKNDNGLSDVDNVNYAQEFYLDSTSDVYIYDYAESLNSRVNIGHVTNVSKAFWNTCTTDDYDSVCIDWSAVLDEGITPNLALIKTTNDYIEDIVVFEAE